jgi:hypothetical protein
MKIRKISLGRRVWFFFNSLVAALFLGYSWKYIPCFVVGFMVFFLVAVFCFLLEIINTNQ